MHEPRKGPTVDMRKAENMLSKRIVITAVGFCLIPASLVLAGCDVDSDPEPDLDRVRSVWEMDIPADAEVEDYWSSEVDLQGGRDDLYVVSIPQTSRGGTWDPVQYTEGVPASGSPDPADIARASGAPLAEDIFDELSCQEPVRRGQDYILLCYHPRDDLFYIFEQVF